MPTPNRPRRSSDRPPPGPDPQMPIDTHVVNWVTVEALISPSMLPIVYVLAAGSEVAWTEVDTNKGRLSLGAGAEHWYSATVRPPDVTRASAIRWNVQAFDSQSDPLSDLAAAINASSGLVNKSGPLAHDLQAPAGAVAWSSDTLPSGVTSFDYLDVSGYHWHLSLSQSRSKISTIVWSTDDPTIAGTSHALPEAFGAGTLFLPKLAAPTVAALYGGYER